MGFHFRASLLSNTKVSLCVCVLMILLRRGAFYFLVTPKQIRQPVTESAAFSSFRPQHIIVALSCYTLLSQTFLYTVHQTERDTHPPPPACLLEG